MTNRITTYECEICETKYSDQRSAEKCEDQGEPRNRLDLPALFAVASPNGGLPEQYYHLWGDDEGVSSAGHLPRYSGQRFYEDGLGQVIGEGTGIVTLTEDGQSLTGYSYKIDKARRLSKPEIRELYKKDERLKKGIIHPESELLKP